MGLGHVSATARFSFVFSPVYKVFIQNTGICSTRKTQLLHASFICLWQLVFAKAKNDPKHCIAKSRTFCSVRDFCRFGD